jgi:hypothetical protein
MVFSNPQSMGVSDALLVEQMNNNPEQRAQIGDNFAHAAGRICVKCDREIKDREPARRRGESGWAHDVCPD